MQACKIKDLVLTKDRLCILDLCFGLGYNSFLAIKVALEANPDIELRIFALENDRSLLEKIKSISYPSELEGIIENYENYIEIIFDDARKSIKNFADDFFDAVFFDPFSPKVCPELWTKEFIQEVVNKTKPGAYISTYSSARVVKENFAASGCEIFEGPKCGRRTGGVLACRQIKH